MLSGLGVTADEEAVYRLILSHPGGSTTVLSEQSSLAPTRLRSVLASLEHKGMISRRGGRALRFQAAPPAAVVEALAATAQERVTRARLEIPQLEALVRHATDQLEVTEIVEVLTSRAAVVERSVQFQRAARVSLDVFVRPPFAELDPGEAASLAKPPYAPGVQVRAIYDESILEMRGLFEHVRLMTRSFGEEARLVPDLPMKLIIVDRSMALVPTESKSGPADEAALVVHRSGLLDALIALFDLYWQRGAPFALGASALEDGAGADALVSLLTAGLKDEAIARNLGLSVPTVRRRIAALLSTLEVSGRFQAGLELGRRGWPERAVRDILRERSDI